MFQYYYCIVTVTLFVIQVNAAKSREKFCKNPAAWKGDNKLNDGVTCEDGLESEIGTFYNQTAWELGLYACDFHKQLSQTTATSSLVTKILSTAEKCCSDKQDVCYIDRTKLCTYGIKKVDKDATAWSTTCEINARISNLNAITSAQYKALTCVHVRAAGAYDQLYNIKRSCCQDVIMNSQLQPSVDYPTVCHTESGYSRTYVDPKKMPSTSFSDQHQVLQQQIFLSSSTEPCNTIADGNKCCVESNAVSTTNDINIVPRPSENGKSLFGDCETYGFQDADEPSGTSVKYIFTLKEGETENYLDTYERMFYNSMSCAGPVQETETNWGCQQINTPSVSSQYPNPKYAGSDDHNTLKPATVLGGRQFGCPILNSCQQVPGNSDGTKWYKMTVHASGAASAAKEAQELHDKLSKAGDGYRGTLSLTTFSLLFGATLILTLW
jgi:hypothetical protein